MTIQVTGRQWFWDVEYPDHHVRTANEIHIPVDETVTIVALSGDVIHSFWVPELNRKIDMIPGQRERDPAARRPCRRLSRAVRGVLRPAARAHGVHGRRRAAATRSTRGSPASRKPAPQPQTVGGAARPAGAARVVVRLLPHDRRHERERPDRTRPDPPRVAPVDRRRRRAQHARVPRRLDPRSRST